MAPEWFGAWLVSSACGGPLFFKPGDSERSAVLFEYLVKSWRILCPPDGFGPCFCGGMMWAIWTSRRMRRLPGGTFNTQSCARRRRKLPARSLRVVVAEQVLRLRRCGSWGLRTFPQPVVRKNVPRGGVGPEVISYIGEAGTAAAFRGQTSKVSRYCARKRVDARDVGDAARNPAPLHADGMEVWQQIWKRARMGASGAGVWSERWAGAILLDQLWVFVEEGDSRV